MPGTIDAMDAMFEVAIVKILTMVMVIFMLHGPCIVVCFARVRCMVMYKYALAKRASFVPVVVVKATLHGSSALPTKPWVVDRKVFGLALRAVVAIICQECRI